jgi:DNA-binding PadR family transcriptional regulator
MHGHHLRLLAEEEHIDQWTDITVGALYGAIKRLATDDLIIEVRVEREGSYPERQVWAITSAGRETLSTLRRDGVRDVVVKTDPFDLAMTRLDPNRLDDLDEVIRSRIARLRELLTEASAAADRADPYLTVSERVVMKHKQARLQADLAWHHELLEHLPEIIADELSRKD